MLGEGVEKPGVRVRHQDHIGLVDTLPADDRRAVEHLAVVQQFIIYRGGGQRQVLLLAQRVGEPQINEFDFFIPDFLEEVMGAHLRLSLMGWEATLE